MATSSRDLRRWAIALAAAIALVAAAVASLTSSARSSQGSRGARTAQQRVRGPFSWLHSAAAPRSWSSATTASGGATLFYPPGWKPIPGDRGTVTASLRRGGLYHGYLNVTPRQGAEQRAGWAAFRMNRNAEEGDRSAHTVAAAENLTVGAARASCVIDDYLSRVGSHPYREIACIVSGRHFTNVFVGAALVPDWPTLGPLLERSATALIVR